VSGLPLERLGRALGLHVAGSIYAVPRGAGASRRGRTQLDGVRLAGHARASGPAAGVLSQPKPTDLTASLRAEIDRWTTAGFASLCDVAHREPDSQLLDPPPPWRGRLRLLHALDPNTGDWVLLIVRAELARTCHEAAAASFGISPTYYRPTREV
jgi:hypothetical protein